MQTPNVLGEPEYPNLPECENDSVGQISRDNRDDICWLSGIIDGEGCISVLYHIRKTGRGAGSERFQPRLEIRTTCPFMAQRITKIYSELKIKFFWQWIKPQRDKKEIISICVSAQNSLAKLINITEPFLTTKRDIARLFQKYFEWRMNMQKYSLPRETKKEISRKLSELRLLSKERMHCSWSLQRLPRRASEVIDLSNLEAVV